LLLFLGILIRKWEWTTKTKPGNIQRRTTVLCFTKGKG